MKESGSQALSAGGAAACWQKNLTWHTARLQRLQQLCKWVQPLAETRPKLRERPLWGECLAELTRPEVQDEVPNPETPQSQHGRANQPELASLREGPHDDASKPLAARRKGTSGRRLSGHQLHGEKTLPDHASQPHGLDRKVSQTFLEQITGQTRRDTGNTVPAPRRHSQRDKFAGKSLPPSQQVMLSPHEWLNAVARRAGRFFDWTVLPDARALAAQWCAGLDGELAPSKLLRSHLGGSSVKAVHSTQKMKDKAAPHQPFGIQSNQAPSASEMDPSSPRSAPTSLLVTSWRSDAEKEWSSSDRIGPPTVVSSLSPLVPPQGSYEPVPAPATMITRQQAGEEAAASEYDLEGLAENIKRILDEEARRHGIDV